MNEPKKQLEKHMTEALEQGEMQAEAPEEAAVRRLIPPYEIRSRAELDPIVEETKKIRRLAKEPDDRYGRYMSEKATTRDEDRS